MIYWLAFGALAGTGVLLSGLLLGHFTAKTNPVLRSSILVGSAGLSLILPALAYFLKKYQLQVEVPVSTGLGAHVAAPSHSAWESPAILLWCAGTLYLLARSGICILKTKAMVRRSKRVLDQRVWEASRGLRRRKAVILESGEITSPVVVGFVQPTILFPIGLVQRLDDIELRAVLAHEFSHVSHGHTRIGLLMALVKAMYWPNPLIHILSRQVFRAFEEAADAETLEQVSSRDFSRALLNLAAGHHLKSPELGLSILSHRAGLEERLSLLSDPARKATMKKHTFRLFGSLTALAIASVLTAAVRVAGDSGDQESPPAQPEINVVQIAPNPPEEPTDAEQIPDQNIIVEVPLAPEAPPQPEEYYGVLVEDTPEAIPVEGVLVEVVEETPLLQTPTAVAPPAKPSRAPATPVAPKSQEVAAPVPIAKPRPVPTTPAQAPRARVSPAPRSATPVPAPVVSSTEPSIAIAPVPTEPQNTVTAVITEGQAKPVEGALQLKPVPLLQKASQKPLMRRASVPLLNEIPLIKPRIQEPLVIPQRKLSPTAGIPLLSKVPLLLSEKKPEPAKAPASKETP